MDIYCPRCGEPWEFETLHEEAQERYGIEYYIYEQSDQYGSFSTLNKKHKNPSWNSDDYDKVYQRVKHEFQAQGCRALRTITDGSSCKPESQDAERDRTFGLTRSEAATALYDVLGDDMDGAAAMLEDMGF